MKLKLLTAIAIIIALASVWHYFRGWTHYNSSAQNYNKVRAVVEYNAK